MWRLQVESGGPMVMVSVKTAVKQKHIPAQTFVEKQVAWTL